MFFTMITMTACYIILNEIGCIAMQCRSSLGKFVMKKSACGQATQIVAEASQPLCGSVLNRLCC